MHMRTTITIPEAVLEETLKVSGKRHYSDAIVSTLKAYLALKERLAFLDRLFEKNLPHSFRKIKKQRKKGRWSS